MTVSKVLVLTTETLHHAFFVRELRQAGHEVTAFVETGSPSFPFPVAHPYEEERDAHERRRWFDGGDGSVRDEADVLAFASLNDGDAVEAVHRYRADVAVVFGTGKLRPEVLSALPRQKLNLHGGDPERYRGLDTHLWSIYHRDWSGLVTTLHDIRPELDTGDIVERRRIPVYRNMPLHELRAANTELCVRLTAGALRSFAQAGRIAKTPQSAKGRYYSAMPAVLKSQCLRAFATYTRDLDGGCS